jgi:hypothetical protein
MRLVRKPSLNAVFFTAVGDYIARIIVFFGVIVFLTATQLAYVITGTTGSKT